jgi:hypothetical protein
MATVYSSSSSSTSSKECSFLLPLPVTADSTKTEPRDLPRWLRAASYTLCGVGVVCIVASNRHNFNCLGRSEEALNAAADLGDLFHKCVYSSLPPREAYSFSQRIARSQTLRMHWGHTCGGTAGRADSTNGRSRPSQTLFIHEPIISRPTRYHASFVSIDHTLVFINQNTYNIPSHSSNNATTHGPRLYFRTLHRFLGCSPVSQLTICPKSSASSKFPPSSVAVNKF